ncbi:MAG TPA: DSD1 family PLP-dependent enzyme [Spirochaetes bacterium]|nr:DSD1 family PLP-dependent enzyme [Spirochaetota bacterium]
MVYVAVLLIVLILLALLRPADRGGFHDVYFSGINGALKEGTPGLPCIICDLDRLDRNIAAVTTLTGRTGSLRIVTKSLPSIKLLRYIMERVGTKNIMALHLPFLPLLLEGLGFDTNVLMGKPLPSGAVRDFFAAQKRKRDAARAVRWLVDTPERLREHEALAKDMGLSLNVGIELDIGLERGGVADTERLSFMLSLLRDSKFLLFAGFMGYDGHVPHAPPLFRSRRSSVRRAFNRSMDRYRSFYNHAHENFPELFTGGQVFNSGGTGTFRFFSADEPVTDIAVGGAFLRPDAYPALSVQGLEPALFIAAPVLKAFNGFRVPFKVPFQASFLYGTPICVIRSVFTAGDGPAGSPLPRAFILLA